LVRRERLAERLSHTFEAKLTLVSAPPGFGKSTLIANELMAQQRGRHVAWLTLDAGDNNPPAFWSYVVRALNAVDAGIREDTLAMAESGEVRTSELLGHVLNDLASAPSDVVLVLDDYHLIDAAEVHEQVAYALDHLPPGAHLAIATRSDPPLPLSRLRVRGELVELRASDLRFTTDEAEQFLDQRMGLRLTQAEVASLEARTEGWIAALQLAALSLAGRLDAAAFIDDFAGDDRYVVDYLTDEVLRRQPDEIRTFLLQTSVLTELTAELCDYVLETGSSQSTLEDLERRNLFVIPLDGRRRRYRYHQLFAEVLQAQLIAGDADVARRLHDRASRWYEQNNDPGSAIRHALAAGDAERAADLVEVQIPELRRRRQDATFAAWVTALPAGVLRQRPVLSVALAGIRLNQGQTEEVEDLLAQAEENLKHDGDEAAGRSGADRTQARRLSADIAVFRTALSFMGGDMDAVISFAQTARASIPADDYLALSGPEGFTALALWNKGDLEAALEWWQRAATDLEAAGHAADVLGSYIGQADIKLAQGKLRDAETIYREGLRAGSKPSNGPVVGTADMHIGLSSVHLERDDMAAARASWAAADSLGEAAGGLKFPYRSRVALAEIELAEGHFDRADALLQDAERVYWSDFFPDIRPIAALRARLRISQDRLDDAFTWARERNLTADDQLSYLSEFEHITLARLLLASSTGSRGRSDSVDNLRSFLGRLIASAEAGGRQQSVIELLVLTAAAGHVVGKTSQALDALSRAMSLAEPERYVRIFLSAGGLLKPVLEAALRRGQHPEYTTRLLAAFGKAERTARKTPGLTEPLSEREIEVLRLLPSELSGPDLAAQLFISLNTLRAHTKSIYAKLGVNSRRAAVERAVALRILDRGVSH
jgi:LuxR family maltose regulon positive regulatory protein